jgi:hypothetical protein
VLLVALLLPVLVPAAATAAPVATGYLTTVNGTEPDLPGVTLKTVPDGAYLVLRNTSATPVVVEGYQHEPYLRITDHGVWQNKLSPAVYLNKEQYIDSIPSDANASKAPVWVKVSSASSARWHDHRIHWMGASQPPAVADDPGRPHLIKAWTIPVRYGDRTVLVHGKLEWEPESRTRFYVAMGALAAAVLVVVLLGLVARRRRAAAGTRQSD